MGHWGSGCVCGVCVVCVGGGRGRVTPRSRVNLWIGRPERATARVAHGERRADARPTARTALLMRYSYYAPWQEGVSTAVSPSKASRLLLLSSTRRVKMSVTMLYLERLERYRSDRGVCDPGCIARWQRDGRPAAREQQRQGGCGHRGGPGPVGGACSHAHRLFVSADPSPYEWSDHFPGDRINR